MSTTTERSIAVAPLGRRLLASLIDRIVPSLVMILMVLINQVWTLDGWLIYDVILVAALWGWVMVQWWLYATRKAGLGYRVMGLQLVHISSGKPIGWGRMCLRTLVLQACWTLFIPGIIMVIALVVHERRLGWMDMAARSIAVRRKQRRVAPEAITPTPAKMSSPANSVVGLPAHLTSGGFDGTPAMPTAPTAPPPPIDRVPDPSQPTWDDRSGFAPTMPSQDIGSAPGSGFDAPPSRAIPGQQPGFSAPVSQTPVSQQAPADPWTQQVPQRSMPAGAQPTLGEPFQHAPAPVSQPSQPVTSAPISQVPGFPATHQEPTHGGQAPLFGQRTSVPGEPSPMAGQPNPSGTGWPVPTQPEAVAAQPETPIRMKPRQVADEGDEGTRLVQKPNTRPADEGWILRLDDGRTIKIDGKVLLGRAPVPREGESAVAAVAAGEPSRTVSKTHLAIDVDARGPFLVDRGSTNGTAVYDQQGDLHPCPADQVIRLVEGQIVSFGERQLQLMRERTSQPK